MKKLLVVLLAIALFCAAGLTTLAVMYRYENIKTEQRLKADKAKADAASAQAKIVNAKDDELAALKAHNATLVAECQKGVAAYERLTPYTQTLVPAPNCDAK